MDVRVRTVRTERRSFSLSLKEWVDVSSLTVVFDYLAASISIPPTPIDARIPVSRYSPGAVQAKLHFAIVTDHFRLDARPDGLEGYHNNLLLIVGEEISPRYKPLPGLRHPKPIGDVENRSDSRRDIDEMTAQGGFGFISIRDHAARRSSAAGLTRGLTGTCTDTPPLASGI